MVTEVMKSFYNDRNGMHRSQQSKFCQKCALFRIFDYIYILSSFPLLLILELLGQIMKLCILNYIIKFFELQFKLMRAVDGELIPHFHLP